MRNVSTYVMSTAFAVGLLLPAIASATVLYATPLKRSGTGSLSCRVFNAGTKPITVLGIRFNSFDGFGGYGSAGCADGTELAPDTGCIAVVGAGCFSSACRCKVEFLGAKKSVRGALVVTDSAGNDVAVTPLQ